MDAGRRLPEFLGLSPPDSRINDLRYGTITFIYIRSDDYIIDGKMTILIVCVRKVSG
jgi:hypothetical protein